MGYLAELVNEVGGCKDIIFVGTGMILINSSNEVLMASRTDNGQWSLPGGSLEIGETLKECVIRETLEETGIVVSEDSVNLNSAIALVEPVSKNGIPIYIVSISFWCNDFNDGSFKLDEREFSGYCWYDIGSIDDLDCMTQYTREALREYNKNNKGTSK